MTRSWRRILIVFATGVTALVPAAANAAPTFLGSARAQYEASASVVSPDDGQLWVLANDRAWHRSARSFSTATSSGIGALSTPSAAVFSLDGSRLYVLNSVGSVSVINTATDSTVGTDISLGGDAADLQRTTDGRYVVSLDVGATGHAGATIIDSSSAVPVGGVRTSRDGLASGLALSPDSSTGYVVDFYGQHLDVFDLATATVTDSIDLGITTQTGVAATPDGRFVYVSNANDNSVSVIATATLSVVARIPVGDYPTFITASPDSSRIYVLNESTVAGAAATVSVISPAIQTVVATYAVANVSDRATSTLNPMALSPNGRYLYVVSEREREIATVDTTSGNVTRLAPSGLGGSPVSATFSHDSQRAYVTYTTAASATTNNVAYIATASAGPAAPTGVVAVSGSRSATISWSAPVDDGGANVTGYTVTATPGGATCAWSSGPLSCTITGLTDGTAYSFSVTATTFVGTSAASTASAAIVVGTTPSAPLAVAATAGLLSASVSWNTPATSGGPAITSYTVTATPGGATCTSTTTRSCIVRGLSNTKAYTFTVHAINAAGSGTRSAGSSAVRPFKRLAMRTPRASQAAIVSQVTSPTAASITQSATTKQRVCSTKARVRKRGIVSLRCALNASSRKALRKNALRVTIATTLTTSAGATFYATHAVVIKRVR